MPSMSTLLDSINSLPHQTIKINRVHRKDTKNARRISPTGKVLISYQAVCIQLQFSNRFRNHRSVSSQRIQAERYKSGSQWGQVKWLFYCPTGSPNILNRISHIISIFKNTLILNQSSIHHVCCIYPSYNPVLFQMLYKAIQITK